MTFTRLKNVSPWRKLALASWKRPRDPSVYGQYECDGTNALSFLQDYNRRRKANVTLTHFMAKAIALIIAEHDDLNGIIKGGSIYKRDTVDIFCQVAIAKSDPGAMENLSGAKITNADKKSLQQIATELTQKAEDIRNHRDPQFQKTFWLAGKLPVWLLKPLLRLHEWAVYHLNLNFPTLGIVPDPFGSAMLTSVGSLGVPPGFAPLVPPSRCPLLVCVGRVENKPWVVGDQIQIRPVIPFTVTFDHRFMDGLSGARMFRTFLKILDEPHQYMEA